MFLLVLNRHYSGRKLKKWLDNEVDFTTQNGKRVTLSMIYRMLKNPFYYGEFSYGWKMYKGTHEPIVSKQLFNDMQKQLEVAPKNWGVKTFEFVKMLTCGKCVSEVSAEEKFKYRKDGTATKYVYYHCTGGKDRDCKQPYVREEEILTQLVEMMDIVSIKKLGMRERIEEEIERYEKFTVGVLGRKETGGGKKASTESKYPKVCEVCPARRINR